MTSIQKREDTPLHQDIRCLTAQGKSDGAILAELSPKYGKFSKSTVKWQRTKMKRSSEVFEGRKRKFSEEEQALVIDELISAQSQKNNKEIGNLIREVHKRNEIENKGRVREDFQIGDSTVRKLIRKLAPEVETKPIVINKRREESMNDLYNGISQVVLTHVLQGCIPNNENSEPLRHNSTTNPLRIHPSDIYNFDAVGCELNGDIIENLEWQKERNGPLKKTISLLPSHRTVVNDAP